MTTTAAVARDANRGGWRRWWLGAAALLVVIEVAAILWFFRTRFGMAWRVALLDVLVLGAIVAVIVVIVRRMPDTRRGDATAAGIVVIAFGALHAAVSLFGALAVVGYAVARIPPPLRLVLLDPGLALSLLASVGLTPVKVIGGLAVILALHLLLWWPIARTIVAGARRWRGIGRLRLPLGVVAPACIVIAAGLYATLSPDDLVREPLHRSLRDSFVMAPPELMLATRPARALPPGPPLPHARPLILIIVDALRPDRMGVYKPALDTTPFLSGLARAGTLRRIDHAYGGCSFSFCGIMGILSSRTWDDFGPAPTTILDVLAAHRYRNYLFLAGNHDHFGNLALLYGARIAVMSDEPLGGPVLNDDPALVERLRRAPFPDPAHSFLYMHLMSAHVGSFLLPPYRPAGPASRADAFDNLYPGPLFARRYDLSVRQADEMIRRIFAVLAAKGMLADATIVITADHGERLGEDGRYMHGSEADGRILPVPLLVYDRASPPYPARPIAGHVDIAPTLLAAAGAPIPAAMTGVPLQRATARVAVPFGTSEETGMIARLGDRTYRYACARDTGVFTARRIAAGALDGPVIPRDPTSQALYAMLDTLFRHLPRARRVDLAPC